MVKNLVPMIVAQYQKANGLGEFQTLVSILVDGSAVVARTNFEQDQANKEDAVKRKREEQEVSNF